MFPIDIYVTQALHGLVYGMLLFLVASGLTLVLGMMGVFESRPRIVLHAGRLFCLFCHRLFRKFLVEPSRKPAPGRCTQVCL